MSFIPLIPLAIGSGRQSLSNAVHCRADGAALQFVISGDVAKKVGLTANDRAHCSLGMGQHAGILAINKATNGSDGTYKVQANGSKFGHVLISIGAAHFGQRGNRFTTIKLNFEVNGDTLMVALPKTSEIAKNSRPSLLNTQSAAA